MPQPRSDRREQILQALAAMLEAGPETKITTAKLAAQVGVSEAALYRHFPSKTKIFEALIDFSEETIFSRIKLITNDDQSALECCNRVLMLVLGFCERNPGITRLLHGGALAGEPARVHQRVAQLFDRLETQLRITLRQAELQEGLRTRITVNDAAGLMLAAAEGRICQSVRSQFKRSATDGWRDQWAMIIADLMRPTPA